MKKQKIKLTKEVVIEKHTREWLLFSTLMEGAGMNAVIYKITGKKKENEKVKKIY